MRGTRPIVPLICALLCPGGIASKAACSQLQGEPSKLVIVSVEHSVDSLGETVYAIQGEDERNVPVVPGVLIYPRPLKTRKPKFSKALKKKQFSGDVSVLAVITATGDVVDVEGSATDNPEATACAIEAVKGYRFAPPTLDGKPVAIRLKVVVNFKIY